MLLLCGKSSKFQVYNLVFSLLIVDVTLSVNEMELFNQFITIIDELLLINQVKDQLSLTFTVINKTSLRCELFHLFP